MVFLDHGVVRACVKNAWLDAVFNKCWEGSRMTRSLCAVSVCLGGGEDLWPLGINLKENPVYVVAIFSGSPPCL